METVDKWSRTSGTSSDLSVDNIAVVAVMTAPGTEEPVVNPLVTLSQLLRRHVPFRFRRQPTSQAVRTLLRSLVP